MSLAHHARLHSNKIGSAHPTACDTFTVPHLIRTVNLSTTMVRIIIRKPSCQHPLHCAYGIRTIAMRTPCVESTPSSQALFMKTRVRIATGRGDMCPLTQAYPTRLHQCHRHNHFHRRPAGPPNFIRAGVVAPYTTDSKCLRIAMCIAMRASTSTS
jgi:hypothetical protein